MSLTSTVTIAGNLTRDPELRILASGQATAELAVAVNRRWQDAETHKWEEATSYFDVVCWGDLAHNVAESAARGTRVVISGRLDQRSWTTRGQRRTKVEITADDVALSLRFSTAQAAPPATGGTEEAIGAAAPVGGLRGR